MDAVAAQLREQVIESRQTASILGATENLDPTEAQRLFAHPLPYWVELMTVSYLRSFGGEAERKGDTWNLLWPDGERYKNVVFANKEAKKLPTVRHLTLEDSKVRGLINQLPRFVPGQPVPVTSPSDILSGVFGV